MASELTPRSTVGREAAVPRKRTRSGIRLNISDEAEHGFCVERLEMRLHRPSPRIAAVQGLQSTGSVTLRLLSRTQAKQLVLIDHNAICVCTSGAGGRV